MLMSSRDHGMAHTHALFTRLRAFAAAHARRNFVLLNAHLFEDPFVHLNNSQQVTRPYRSQTISLAGLCFHADGGGAVQLIFDFHAFPSRPQPEPGAPENCTLNASFSNSICALPPCRRRAIAALLALTGSLRRPALGWRRGCGRLEDQVAALYRRA